MVLVDPAWLKQANKNTRIISNGDGLYHRGDLKTDKGLRADLGITWIWIDPNPRIEIFWEPDAPAYSGTDMTAEVVVSGFGPNAFLVPWGKFVFGPDGSGEVTNIDLGISADDCYCAWRMVFFLRWANGHERVHFAIRPEQYPPVNPVRCTRTARII